MGGATSPTSIPSERAKRRTIRILGKPSYALAHEFATLYVSRMVKYAYHSDATL